MGMALVKATVGEVADFTAQWARSRHLKVAEHALAGGTHGDRADYPVKKIRGTMWVVVIDWSLREATGGTTVRMAPRRAYHLMAGTYALGCFGIWSCLRWLLKLGATTASLGWTGIVCGLVAIYLAIRWLADAREELLKLEMSFWDSLQRSYDAKLLTPALGPTERAWVRILFDGLLCGLAAWVWGLVGAHALIFASLLIGPLFLASALARLHRDAPEWQWRLRVLFHVSKWSRMVSSVLLIVWLLFFAEGMITGLGKVGYDPRSRNVLEYSGEYRDVLPATAERLESDAKRRMSDWGTDSILKGTVSSGKQSDSMLFLTEILPYALCALWLALVAGLILFPYTDHLASLLKSARSWRLEASGRNWRRGPAPAPASGTQVCKAPMLTGTIMCYYAFGGALNLVAAAFGFEGLSYMLVGQTLLRAKDANLFSWLFAWSEYLFGSVFGRPLADVLVVLIALPFLLCLGKLVHRSCRSLYLYFRLSIACLRNRGGTLSEPAILRGFVHQVCSNSAIPVPTVVLTRASRVVAKVGWSVVRPRGILEISRGAVALLEDEELKAVIAHELGHVRQGLWRVAVLKALSVLAFFPNYYLTLCLNWPKREMDADMFALQVTQNPGALRRALLKLSAAELLSPRRSRRSDIAEKLWSFRLLKKVRETYEEVLAAARFFFGDGLLGYTHPFLSERLAAATALEKDAASSSSHG